MKINMYDCVKLVDGQEGTVIEIFDNGEAFMIEIADDEGRTLETPIVRKDKISEITYKA